MAMTPAYALAHVFLPNLIKLKGAVSVMNAFERKDKVFFDQMWQQAYVTHNPTLFSATRDPYRVGVITLPTPTEMGEAHMAAVVTSKSDPAFLRYYLLEHDYVLATRTNRTIVSERNGKEHHKLGDGTVLTGAVDTDLARFADLVIDKAKGPGIKVAR